MATVSRTFKASTDDVWRVLADGWTYSNWVVGSSHVRAVSADWPAVGAKLHHASGIWPLVARDETEVVSVDPGHRLELTAKGRPFGVAVVVMELASTAAGTVVTMAEEPTAGPGAWLDNPVLELIIKRRNVEALARLAAIAERHTEPAQA